MFLPNLVEPPGTLHLGLAAGERAVLQVLTSGWSFWRPLPFGVLEKTPRKHVWAHGGLTGLYNSHHHCQGGVHNSVTSGLKSQSTTSYQQPGPGIEVSAMHQAQTRPSGVPATGTRRAGPSCYRARTARSEGRDFELLSYDWLMVNRLLWG